MGCHSLVDSSAPKILWSWFRIPYTFLAFIIYSQICGILSCEKNENKQKRPALAHLKKV